MSLRKPFTNTWYYFDFQHAKSQGRPSQNGHAQQKEGREYLQSMVLNPWAADQSWAVTGSIVGLAEISEQQKHFLVD